MKKILITIIATVFSLQGLIAQESNQLFLVREDMVLPSMVDEYERSIRDIKSYLEEKNEKDFTFYSHLMDDYSFIHMTPIPDLSKIENGIQSYYAGKVDDPEFYLLQDNMFETVDSYMYYILKYHNELSYVPENDDWSDGKQYRKWMFYQFMPNSQEEVKEVLKAWRSLYANKKIEMGYRIFAGMIGVEQPTFIFTTWAESPAAYQDQLEKVSEILGEEGSVLWNSMQQYIQDVEVIEGWYLPQYSYNEGIVLTK